MFRLSALTAGVLLDWIFGEPRIFVHPVCRIGNLISRLEKMLRRWMPGHEFLGGCILVLAVAGCSTMIPAVILGGLHWIMKADLYQLRRIEKWTPVLVHCLVEGDFSGIQRVLCRICWGLETFWCFQLLAAKSLYRESGKVRKALVCRDTEGARTAVSMIVGRDTTQLDEAGIARAAVETVAENTSDGVIAPLLFMALFGVAGGFFYKAVNTMDSMVGYKNERYRLFGRAAAKLDDFCNFLPARISGGLMAAAAWVLGLVTAARRMPKSGMAVDPERAAKGLKKQISDKQPAEMYPEFDGKHAWNIFCRDRKKHASPNSAHGEAACAGALHIRLAGDAWYFGELHHKPWIGDDDRPIEAEDIRRAGKLMIVTEILGVLLCWVVYVLFWRR